jgi:small GTP-binding protein
VGKSSLMSHFVNNKFTRQDKYAENLEKIIEISSEEYITFQIGDTMGQEAFPSISRSYYKNALGVLLVYDISKRETFENIPRWYDEVKANCNDSTLVILIGNKTDTESK